LLLVLSGAACCGSKGLFSGVEASLSSSSIPFPPFAFLRVRFGVLVGVASSAFLVDAGRFRDLVVVVEVAAGVGSSINISFSNTCDVVETLWGN
jgi:hypothetical protein